MKSKPGMLIGYFDQSGRCRFNTLKGFFLQDIAAITHVKANGNYCDLFVTSGEKKLITQTLASVQKELEPYGFKRIGRSMMINLNYLSQVDRQRSTCSLNYQDGGVELEINHRYVKVLSDLF